MVGKWCKDNLMMVNERNSAIDQVSNWDVDSCKKI